MISRPTALDLFCGAGGLSYGLADAGFEVVGAADAWSVATKTYKLNFDHPVITADLGGLSASALLEELDISAEVDLVAGGPPCQGFSVQRIGADQDSRNGLVLEFARFVAEISPRTFLMENVPGLLGKRGRHVADAFIGRLGAEYNVTVMRVNAADYGVPQLRRRIFIYGWRHGEQPIVFPAPTHQPEDYMTVNSAFAGLTIPPDDFSPAPGDALHRRTRLSHLNLDRLRHIPPGGGMKDLPMELRADCHKDGPDRIGHRNVYGRLDRNAPASTITARFDSFTRGRFAHPSDNRNITLREGARLQTFPDTYRFEGTQEEIAALIGNAVPPRLGAAVGAALREAIAEQPVLGDRQGGEVCSVGDLQPALVV